MSDHIRFDTPTGAVDAAPATSSPDPDAPGARIRVDLTADELDRAYDAAAFDLPTMIPGGHVPVPDRSRAVTVELRLADEHEVLLAPSSRDPRVLLGDMVGLTEAGRDEHVVLDAGAWQVTALIQDGGGPMHLVTLHDGRPEGRPR